MQTDPLADFCSALQNARNAHKPEVVLPHSRIKEAVARVLVEEGYLEKVEVVPVRKGIRQLRLTLREVSPFQKARRISRPGCRRYVGAKEVPRILGGLGLCILSTPKGILAGHRAKRVNVGGELLLSVE
ncbi:30S ribosomal protein S8 [Methylacidimicrobium cyclopophantes]|uniref:Small ribosomal subunit protein uS8 n=1 Tax=Methylacidimicrobium cyclopophantes TaxID=1041766 RepID=A0A5E6MDF8_9BACT|nr:30S ribosomal protein S8 [Methylacidimicrobium cyclopophantes]VVM05852.1 30S ribosomal protein S8 [Methylacidimicrobium cyclopophantes]